MDSVHQCSLGEAKCYQKAALHQWSLFRFMLKRRFFLPKRPVNIGYKKGIRLGFSRESWL
jgi:hypothetical protein